MSSLLLDLTTTTFQDLVDDARASIPPFAPGWTDYNISDPGIMLIELLAWNAEAQIYALGHVRQDEREAYSALMGVRARGPQPASGQIWPQLTPGTLPPWGGGMLLAAQTAVHAERGNLPDLFLARSIWLHGAALASVAVAKRDGTRLDYTPVNLRRGGSFPVFGPAPGQGDRLLLGLGKFPVPYISPAGPQLIAVGFRIRNSAVGLTARNAASARFRATLKFGATERAVDVREDSTLGLAQTGVMLIEFPPDALASGSVSTLSLELAAGELFPAPLAERIDLNVLGVVQQREWQDPFTMGAPWPDTVFPLTQSGVCFGDGTAAVAVSIRSDAAPVVSWTVVDNFTAAGPADTVCTVDPVKGLLQFGNGINGAIPANGSLIVASYRTSQGKTANVAGGLSWVLPSMAGTLFGTNLDAVAGGADAEQLDDLQNRSRSALELHPIVTNQDLLAAAGALTGLRVVRAEMAPVGTGPAALRTLVVLRQRDASGDPGAAPETPLWLEAVRRSLSARLTLGQHLRVIGPRYVSLSVQASVAVGANADPTTIASQIVVALQARFASSASASSWPMGTAVEVQSIRGWLRAVPGVLAVTLVQLSSGGSTLTSGTLSLPPTGLPQLSVVAGDITVTRAAMGSSR